MAQRLSQRTVHQQWLAQLTSIPTAAGREGCVIGWITQWVAERKNLQLRSDRAGNLLITHRKHGTGRGRGQPHPLFITAHLDHPAFVVVDVVDRSTVELEFRGGVHSPYFENARIEMFDNRARLHLGTVLDVNADAQPFKRVRVGLTKPSDALVPGNVGRWTFDAGEKLPRIEKAKAGRPALFHTHACDDLAAAAAALAAMDELHRRKGFEHVGVLFTRAEEIGFIGAIAACKFKSIPRNARLICLENSRSFADSPIGAGPIVRVGDKMSVFNPTLTNRISMIMAEHQKSHPDFKWQRKLMPGGTCEATTFSTYGYQSTCLCLPLGNYHNMRDIDGVLAGKRPAKVGPEYISIEDYHGLIEMLVVCAEQIDGEAVTTLEQRMEELFAEFGFVVAG